MGIADRIENILGESLEAVAKKMGYGKSNIYILENKTEELKNEYPLIYRNLESCRHQKDGRTKEQYAKDLIASWIFEDTFLKELKSTKLNIYHNGADKERKILSSSQTLTTSDYIIKKDTKEVNIELMCSYTPYWKKLKRIDLRDAKYTQMVSKKVLLLCVDVYHKEFFIVDTKNCSAKYIPAHPPYGNKPAYSIDLNSIATKEYDMSVIAKTLENFL